MAAQPKPNPERRQPCGCPIEARSVSDLCIACQIEWEEWMVLCAVPALRRALELEVQKPEEEF